MKPTRQHRLTALTILVAMFEFSSIASAQGSRAPSIGTMRDVDYDPKSGLLVAGGDTGLIAWHPGTDESATRLAGGQVSGLALSPGGSQLVYGDPSGSHWVTLPENERLHPLEEGISQGVDFEFSADGTTLLMVSWKSTGFESAKPIIHILRTSDGSEIQRFTEISAFPILPWDAALSPSGDYLAVLAGPGRARIYDTTTGEWLINKSVDQARGWKLVEFTADEKHVIFREQNGLRIYDTETWDHTDIPAFGPSAGFGVFENRQLLASGDGRILPLTGGGAIFDVRNHGFPDPLIHAIVPSPSGDLLMTMSSFPNQLIVWEIATGKKRAVLDNVGDLFSERKFYGHFLPDESGVVYSQNGGRLSVTRFDDDQPSTTESIVTLGDIRQLQYRQYDEKLQLIDLNHKVNGQPSARSLNIATDRFTTIQAPPLTEMAAFSPNGHYIGSIDKNGNGSLRIFETESGKSVTSHRASFSGFAESFSISNVGTQSAIGLSGSRVFLWNGTADRHSIRLPNSGAIRGLAFSPDSKKFCAMTEHGWVYVLDDASHELIAETMVESGFQFILSPTFSPDGRWLAINGQVRSQIWDWAQDEIVLSAPTSISTRSFAFTQDQEFVAIGHYTAIDLYQISPPKRLARFKFENPTEGVNAVAFSQDSKTLAAGSGLGELKFWSLEGQLPEKSIPKLSIQSVEPTTIELMWSPDPGQSLRLESSPDLMNWSAVPLSVPGIVTVNIGQSPAHFFRLIENE